MSSQKVDKRNDFSVALGLTDYVNPILYSVTSITIIAHIRDLMPFPWSAAYILGAAVSVLFGFAIPTVKLLVGLGKMPFSLPVNLVFYVNSGIFLSGLALLKNVLPLGTVPFCAALAVAAAFLVLVYRQTRKFNNVAVLTGAIGYLLIYVSLIAQALRSGAVVSVVFYAAAICLYLMLVGIGIKADLTDARVHWVIEISNILCQASVAVGTLLLLVK